MTSSGSVLARYVQGSEVDRTLGQFRSATASYYEQDGQGSVSSLSDSTGALASSYTYDSYGRLTASTGSVVNSLQYAGREFDLETGFYFNRARYYDSSTGRFWSEDPIAFYGGTNFYSYVSNNPLNFTDPSGLCAKKPCDEWLKDILNLAAEVSRRFQQYNYPMGFLPMYGRRSRAGYWQQLDEKQKTLADEVDEYNNSNCPSPIPTVVTDLATRPLPDLSPGPTPVHIPPPDQKTVQGVTTVTFGAAIAWALGVLFGEIN